MTKGQVSQAPLHSILVGDETMGNNKKPFTITFERVCDQEKSDEIIRAFARRAVIRALEKNGAVAYNVDELLHKYISEEMRNGHKRG
ncbi:hypothetical protein FHS19_006902 [Paenibacillus rhizosphaerae]|uniref:Uncharacterized protein n=1 Tax=Paenibacillus rhizosphaerae TaxID=297318 RepID=A0A839TZ73_9BACL|nr:hypothetical protein [Paenibacillus rhizosphaerae]